MSSQELISLFWVLMPWSRHVSCETCIPVGNALQWEEVTPFRHTFHDFDVRDTMVFVQFRGCNSSLPRIFLVSSKRQSRWGVRFQSECFYRQEHIRCLKIFFQSSRNIHIYSYSSKVVSNGAWRIRHILHSWENISAQHILEVLSLIILFFCCR